MNLEKINKFLTEFNCKAVVHEETDWCNIEGSTDDIDDLMRYLDKKKIANRRALSSKRTQLQLKIENE